MPWYRGVECKSCKGKIAVKELSSLEEGPIDPRGSPGWVGGGTRMPYQRRSRSPSSGYRTCRSQHETRPTAGVLARRADWKDVGSVKSL